MKRARRMFKQIDCANLNRDQNNKQDSRSVFGHTRSLDNRRKRTGNGNGNGNENKRRHRRRKEQKRQKNMEHF